MDLLMTVFAESLFIFENFLVFFGFEVLMEYKGKRPWIGVLFQVFFIYLFQRISSPIVLNFTGVRIYGMVANLIMLIIVTCFFYRGSIRNRIFATSMYVVPAWCAEFLTWPLVEAIILQTGREKISVVEAYSITEYRNLAIILCGQILLILWGISLLIWKIVVDRNWIREYMILAFIPVYKFVIFVVYYSSCETISSASILTGWLIYLFGTLIDAVILYLVTGILKKIYAERELSQVYQKRQEELEYYVQINEYMENVRQLRHEFANQLQVIYGLMEEKNMEKVRGMLEATHKNMENIFGKVQEDKVNEYSGSEN